MRAPRFTTRSLFLLVSLASVAIAVTLWVAGPSREMRRIQSIIEDANLPDRDRQVMLSLCKNEVAWKSGLMKRLNRFRWHQIVWESTATLPNGKPVNVYLFDCYLRPASTAPMNHPLVCVVMDPGMNLVYWNEIAEWSNGFVQAQTIPGSPDELHVTSLANYFRGFGTYRYQFGEDGLLPLGNAMRGNRNARLREHVDTPKSLEELSRQIRQDDSPFDFL